MSGFKSLVKPGRTDEITLRVRLSPLLGIHILCAHFGEGGRGKSRVQTMATKHFGRPLCTVPLLFPSLWALQSAICCEVLTPPHSLPVAPHSHELEARLIDAQKRQRNRREQYIAHGRTSTLQDTN